MLLKKRLEEKLAAAETAEGKGKEKAENGDDDSNDSQDVGLRHINERLADTHDILAEISLENERYATAHDQLSSAWEAVLTASQVP